MINLNEQITENVEIEQVADMISAICPHQDRRCVLEEDFKLTPSENGTGWFFECMVCEGARCTVFLSSD